jgi:hypothetical protein
MNRRLRFRNTSVNAGFSCYNWWHRLWHRFEITDQRSGVTWCSHETWQCSCGKLWKIDKSWVGGIVFIRGEEMPRLDDMTEGEVRTFECPRCHELFTHLNTTGAKQPVPTVCWECRMKEDKI